VTAPLAVVTGASSGIGRALARRCAEHGFDLVIAAGERHIRRAARELRVAGADHVIAVEADLATAEGVQQLDEIVRDAGRPVDALLLDAGAGTGGGAFADVPLDDDLRVIDLNVRSVVHLAKLVVPRMVERGEGRVLITASSAAGPPGASQPARVASKAFGLSFALALREELEDSGVTVSALIATEPEDDPDDVAAAGFEAMMNGEAEAELNRIMATPGSG
jgi:short-subunit dehydrogenase